MIPVAFDGCAGWLHPAVGARGVVLCGPWGFEALCAHRPLRELAEQLAHRGMPCLRYDHPGAGDSLDPAAGDALVEAWIRAVAAAVSQLRATSRAQEVALVGLRLGALLAAEAATRLGRIGRLALLAPPASGRACVRELRAWAQLASGGPDDHGSGVLGEGGVVAGGFVLGAAALEALGRLDPLGSPEPPAARILLLERADARPLGGLAQRWRRAGATVEEEPLIGHAELLRDPLLAEAPTATFARLVDWLARDRPAAPGRPTGVAARPPAALLAGPGFGEELVRLGADGRLAGVLTTPAGPCALRPGRPALLILNTGATHRVGAGRSAVELARAAAHAGVRTLRMDLGGLGDSDPPPGEPRPDIYRRGALLDVRAGIDLLQSRGSQGVVALGICSGAFMALHAALTDPRLVGLVLVNLPRFGWRPFHPLVFVRTRAILASLACASTWRQGLSGRGELAAALRVLGERLFARLAGLLPGPIRRAAGGISRAGRWLRRLAERGTRTLVLYAADDPGLPLFDRVLSGRRGRLMGGALEVEVVARANHAFSDPASRAILIARALDHLERHWPGAAAGGGGGAPARCVGPEPAGARAQAARSHTAAAIDASA